MWLLQCCVVLIPLSVLLHDCRMVPAPTHEIAEAQWELCNHQGPRVLGSQNPLQLLQSIT